MADAVDSESTGPATALASRVAALRPQTDLVQREMFAQVAAGLFGRAPAPPRIGRYSVLSRRGSGGMGTVFAAWDNLLQRRVALKVLHHSQGDRREAILREARALATFVHPNVVQVYDVGQDGDDAFIAMALIEGAEIGHVVRRTLPTARRLAQWLTEAAAGLAAAHAAGLVHGDIKPANLLVGDDGRLRLIDFGLATGLGLEPARGGTQGYRAPELAQGGASRAAADVFALCTTALELREVLGPGRWSSSLRRLLERGRSTDESRRCSMADLAAAFAVAATGQRARGLAILTLIAGAMFLVVTLVADSTPECALAVDGTWHAGARARAEHALARLGARGETAWAQAAPVFDARAQRWLVERDHTCAMPLADRGPSMACLIDHGVALDAMIDQLEGAGTSPRSDQLIDAVGEPQDCRFVVDGSTGDDDELRHALVRVEVADALGDYPGALALATQLHGLARRQGGPAARAEAELTLGRLQALAGDAASGAGLIRDAYFRAAAVGDDRLSARAAIEILAVTSGPLGDVVGAERWRRPLLIALDRGDATVAMRVRALQALARFAEHAGDWATTREMVETLRQGYAQALADDPVARTAVHMLYAGVLRRDGDTRRQVEELQAALSIAQSTRPAEHPDVGLALVALGSAWDDAGELELAQDALVRGIAVLEHAELFDRLGNARYDLGRVYAGRGDPVRAREQYEAAAEGIAKHRGPTHTQALLPMVGLAELAAAANDLDEAQRWYERALAIATTASDRGYMHFGLGQVAAAAEQWDRALALYDQAWPLVGDEQLARPMHCELGFASAQALAGLGNLEAARRSLLHTRVLALREPRFDDVLEAVAAELERIGPVDDAR